jgi:hypothetical protein
MKLPVVESNREAYAKYGLKPELPRQPFDNSFKASYQVCKRHAYIRYILGRTKQEESHSLTFGLTWHRMQEHFSRTLRESDDYVSALAAAFDVADEMLPEESDDRYSRTRGRIKEAFERYLEAYYEHDKSHITVVLEEQAIEVVCPEDSGCVFGGCGLDHSGRVDKLVRGYGGRLWVLDYKTSTYSVGDFDEFIIDSQMVGYVWLASHVIGERVWGVLIDFACINSSKIEFKRYPVAVPDYHIAEWLVNQKEVTRDILERYEKHAYDMSAWTQNTTQCFNFGKYRGARCPYWLDICSKPAYPVTDARLITLGQEFVERRYDIHRTEEAL